MATIAGRTATTRSWTLVPLGTTVAVVAPDELLSDLAGVVTAEGGLEGAEELASPVLIGAAPPGTSADTTTPVPTPPAKRQPGRRPCDGSLPLGAGMGGGPGGAGGRCAGGSAGTSAAGGGDPNGCMGALVALVALAFESSMSGWGSPIGSPAGGRKESGM